MAVVSHHRRRPLKNRLLPSLTPLMALLMCAVSSEICFADGEFIKGADLSILPHCEASGIQYKSNGKVIDVVDLFKQNGCNCVRLRLFVDPPGTDGQVNTLAYTLAMARRLKSAGLPWMLDLHYSDHWANADRQDVPQAWSGLDHQQLIARVHDYTSDTLKAFGAAGCMPGIVAVGNEITNGMVWPDGGPLSEADHWPAFLDLLKAGITAVREAAPRARVMVHIDKGGNPEVSEAFFSRLQQAKVDFDLIGLSYYPFWQPTLDDLKTNLSALSKKYHKDIVVVETSYNYTEKAGDKDPVKDTELPYTISPEGQKRFLGKLMRTVAATPDHHGKGVLYWEPTWINGSIWKGPDWSAEWEPRALFDDQGNALPAISAFKFQP